MLLSERCFAHSRIFDLEGTLVSILSISNEAMHFRKYHLEESQVIFIVLRPLWSNKTTFLWYTTKVLFKNISL